jgi:hypothetical protein
MHVPRSKLDHGTNLGHLTIPQVLRTIRGKHRQVGYRALSWYLGGIRLNSRQVTV